MPIAIMKGDTRYIGRNSPQLELIHQTIGVSGESFMNLAKDLAKQRFFECESKRRYASEQEAEFASKVHRQRFYSCIWCKGYHLTSK